MKMWFRLAVSLWFRRFGSEHFICTATYVHQNVWTSSGARFDNPRRLDSTLKEVALVVIGADDCYAAINQTSRGIKTKRFLSGPSPFLDHSLASFGIRTNAKKHSSLLLPLIYSSSAKITAT